MSQKKLLNLRTGKEEIHHFTPLSRFAPTLAGTAMRKGGRLVLSGNLVANIVPGGTGSTHFEIGRETAGGFEPVMTCAACWKEGEADAAWETIGRNYGFKHPKATLTIQPTVPWVALFSHKPKTPDICEAANLKKAFKLAAEIAELAEVCSAICRP